MAAKIKIFYTAKDFPINQFDEDIWKKAENVLIDKYWSGKSAPVSRHFYTRLLWSEKFLYVRFEANQNEPLIISENPNLQSKTQGLWERDVCEIFLAPNKEEFRRYFEFEIAPSGEWIDLAIHQKSNKRETDLHYNSGMESAALIKKNKILMSIKIDWKAFNKTPKISDIWKGNIFRCIGQAQTRGYLAWQPTLTDIPNFHVPERFGEFEFSA